MDVTILIFTTIFFPKTNIWSFQQIFTKQISVLHRKKNMENQINHETIDLNQWLAMTHSLLTLLTIAR